MSHLRGTYEDLSKYYLREARDCLKSKSYRMAIVAAATSIHLASYFILLVEGEYNQDDKVAKFYDVSQKIKKVRKWIEIKDDVDWLRNARNSVAHPEEWIVPEIKTDSKTGKRYYSAKPKIDDLPVVKKQVFTASMTNELGSLSKLAEESVKKSENILLSLGFPVETGSVNEMKDHIEKEVQRMTGQDVDLEKLG